jgi:hypothetical protein
MYLFIYRGAFMPNQANHLLLAIHITDRLTEVAKVQAVLSEFSTIIKTRLGLHQVGDSYDSPDGIIILELLDNKAKMNELTSSLTTIEGVELKEVIFEH